MISFEELAAALKSEDRYAQMDRLVRRELAAYRTTQEINSELAAYWDQIEQLPFYDDDHVLDAYGGTLDRLIGMCHRDWVYHSIPKTGDQAIEGTAETIRNMLAHFPAEDRLKVLDRASDLVRAQVKIPA